MNPTWLTQQDSSKDPWLGIKKLFTSQQTLDGQQNGAHIVKRRPFVLQDVETDETFIINVGMEAWGDEFHTRSLIWITSWELQRQAVPEAVINLRGLCVERAVWRNSEHLQLHSSNILYYEHWYNTNMGLALTEGYRTSLWRRSHMLIMHAHRSPRTIDGSNPFEEIVSLWKCWDALIARHLQRHRSHDTLMWAAASPQVRSNTAVTHAHTYTNVDSPWEPWAPAVTCRHTRIIIRHSLGSDMVAITAQTSLSELDVICLHKLLTVYSLPTHLRSNETFFLIIVETHNFWLPPPRLKIGRWVKSHGLNLILIFVFVWPESWVW